MPLSRCPHALRGTQSTAPRTSALGRGHGAIRSMLPGVSAEAIDAACAGTVEATGLAHLFHHRTGYSIGLGFFNWIEDLGLRPRESTAGQGQGVPPGSLSD